MTARPAVHADRVLVVDDEPDIVALVAYHLVKAGYRVSTAASGPDAVAQARQERPALIVLDLMLPGMSGFEVLEQLRAEEDTRDVAVLMLTARKDEPDRIRGLSLGADDYLTKPFSPPELILRVGAILRRIQQGQQQGGDTLRVGPIAIDRAAHRVQVEGREVELTPTEYRLLLTPRRAARARAGAGPPPRDGVGGGPRHPDAHGRHARAAVADQAGDGRGTHRDGARVRL